MSSPLDKINIAHKIDGFKHHLEQALKSPTRTFREIKTLNKEGLYLIFNEEELLYIGMTFRQGKNRLREMATSYKLHSFNRKLFAEHLRGENIFRNKEEDAVHVLNKVIAQELIINGQLTLEQFKIYQAEVNNKIKNLSYKFYDCNLFYLPLIEHFAIAVLNPLYND